jgi:hypothetical protein
MKQIKVICLVLAITGFVLSIGCKKVLEQKPVSTIAPQDFWKDKNDSKTWMAGIYNSLQTTLMNQWLDWGEVRSDNMEVSGTGNAQLTMITNTLSANDNDINSITRWTNLYNTISLCNYGIKYLPGMINKNIEGAASEYRDFLGQCYGIRALMYFYGLRVWGKLPILTEPIESLNQQVALPRSPIDSVKKLIQSDIVEALKYLGTTTTLAPSGSSPKYYLLKAAVYALQTDVDMWFQDYDAALDASQNFISLAGANSWVSNIAEWKSIFTDPSNSKETVFNLYWSAVERGTGVGVCSRLGSSSNTNQYQPTDEIWDTLYNRVDPITGKPTDGRYWAYFDTVKLKSLAAYNADRVQLGKFMPWSAAPGAGFVYQGNSNCDVKIPIYRYADIMLLRSEALNQKGRYQEALDIVNKVRSRVGYTVQAKLSDYTGDIKKSIERTILEERQLELLGEGKRWFDLMRIGKIYDFSDNGYEYLREQMNPLLTSRPGGIQLKGQQMGRILFPINSDVINANPKLNGDQNPPYDQ